jgi:hypothetical protein
MAGRRQRNLKLEKTWRRHVAAWKSCDLTVKEYCQRQQLKVEQFRHWRKELRKRDAEQDKLSSQTLKARFAAVTVVPDDIRASDPVVPADGVEILLPNQTRIRCGRSVSADLIAQVLRAAETASC